MKVRKKIGTEGYDIHSLRYTTAVELAVLGLSDEVIMSITGHDRTIRGASPPAAEGKTGTRFARMSTQKRPEQNKNETGFFKKSLKNGPEGQLVVGSRTHENLVTI